MSYLASSVTGALQPYVTVIPDRGSPGSPYAGNPGALIMAAVNPLQTCCEKIDTVIRGDILLDKWACLSMRAHMEFVNNIWHFALALLPPVSGSEAS